MHKVGGVYAHKNCPDLTSLPGNQNVPVKWSFMLHWHEYVFHDQRCLLTSDL